MAAVRCRHEGVVEVTDVRIFLRNPEAGSKLKAYATITFDGCFVVRNVKVIEGSKGLFVAMPSERAKTPCPKCGFRNVVRCRFCNRCGEAFNPTPPPKEGGAESQAEGSTEHRDIAHPITVECRQTIQKRVLEAYEAELAQGGKIV